MPLVLNTAKQSATPIVASAANIHSVVIDLSSQRIILTFHFGEMVGNQFVKNPAFSPEHITLDGTDYTSFIGKNVVPAKNLFDNFKNSIWDMLISKGIFSGTIV